MHKHERKNKMNNDIKLTENDVIKKAILMLKENLLDIKSYINNPMSSTLKLQKVKVEILKANDRLNDIYNVLNSNNQDKLIEIKKLCNILQEEVKAKIEEKEYAEYIKSLQNTVDDTKYYEQLEKDYQNGMGLIEKVLDTHVMMQKKHL